MAAGEDRLPPPNCSWLCQGLSHHPWARAVPQPLSHCAQPSRLTCGRKAAQEAANRAAGWGVWLPQTPCAPLPSPGGALKSTLQ